MAERSLDLICLGRAAVDLYAEQLGARLEDVASFAKYIGGCAANIAVGTARQGLKSSMLVRVGDDHMGRFVRETLAREGVDTGHVSTDPSRLTALVLLGIKDRDTFPLIFYRENCADMNLQVEDFDAAYIGAAKALLVTGTHFSTESINKVSHQAIALAKKAGTKVILDIDYRPVLWGLTSRGMGEIRYIASEGVSQHLQKIVPHCDLIVGTEEEHCIAGGSDDIMVALRNTRAKSQAEIVVKRGPLGCSVFPAEIGNTLDDGITVKGVTVEVLNVLGAGDAFMSGYLRGWINGEGIEKSCIYANACGALVVSRHGCAPAMPSKIELDDYLSRAKDVKRPDLDPRLNHLHRVTNRATQWPQVMALAFDHRSQCEALVKEVGQPLSKIGELKEIIGQAVLSVAKDFPGRAGVLCDGRFGQAVLEHLTGRGLWIARPVELPGSRPLRFETGPNIAQEMRAWPADHTAKCLVFYHPNDGEMLKQEQLGYLAQLQEACIGTGHDLLVEVIPPKAMPSDESTLPRALAEIYAHGIKPDWWKLPAMSDASWRRVAAEIERSDPHCRGVVLLGLEAPEDELAAAFKTARHHPICKGFAIGRSIFMAPARDWLLGKCDAEAFAANVADNYRRLIEIWLAPQSAAA
ncbi:5-dehydro-2-deoxygluconokinase [Dongia sp.]|uniref:bifunctional 5-dehydro-2-deoxygluconokinase/5-dehydro-2- deoxyphosphogluconate aldolase n=1 Tax=Dongia sp. TaxID=1977262 RepID=UPI00375261D6